VKCGGDGDLVSWRSRSWGTSANGIRGGNGFEEEQEEVDTEEEEEAYGDAC
jgi:hypothetical protein